MWLNVGCGPHRAPTPWWNVDRVKRPGNTEPDEVVGDTLPYDDGSVERLYAGHILEHIPMPSVRDVLTDWCRVMKSGGEIGIVGPDVNRALELFKRGRLTRDELWERMEHGTTTSIDAWRRLYGVEDVDSHARHHWNCVPERVMALLEVTGFVNVREVPITSRELSGWPLVGQAGDQFAVLAKKE